MADISKLILEYLDNVESRIQNNNEYNDETIKKIKYCQLFIETAGEFIDLVEDLYQHNYDEEEFGKYYDQIVASIAQKYFDRELHL